MSIISRLVALSTQYIYHHFVISESYWLFCNCPDFDDVLYLHNVISFALSGDTTVYIVIAMVTFIHALHTAQRLHNRNITSFDYPTTCSRPHTPQSLIVK